MKTTISRSLSSVLTLIGLTVMISACSTNYRAEGKGKDNDSKVKYETLLEQYNQLSVNNRGCGAEWSMNRDLESCESIAMQLDRLYVENPRVSEIAYLNAMISYELGKTDKSQYILDTILASQGAHSKAAVLRGMIALQEGNIRYTEELMRRQIQLAPDFGELYEVQAAAYFLDNNYTAARQSLSVAERLGVPDWRLAYHYGLISESELDWAQACSHYRSSIQIKPEFYLPRSRLNGLFAQGTCDERGRFRK